MAANASFMVERCGNAFIPQFLKSGGFFDLLMYFVHRGHDECSEVCQLENDDIVVVLLSLVMIVASGEQVGLLILGARLVVESEMILCQLGDPSCLSSVQLLGELEVLEILMVHPDFYIFSGAHKVMAPFGECEHDGEQLFVVNLLVFFHGAECF